MAKPALSLDQFDVIRTIGIGSFSHVNLCYWRNSGCYVSIKVMSKHRIEELNQNEHVQNEREILQMMQHPNVVKLYGTFQDSINLYLVMQYVPGGEVFSHLRTLQRFDPDVVRFYGAEVLLVFQQMHAHSIIYRDLKPENLLFDSDGHIIFIDFGFAKRIQDRTYTLCGTPEYLAPEIIRGEGASFSSDWWSYGVLLYEMLVGQTPFLDENENQMYQNICKGEVNYPPFIDQITRDLLQGLFQVEPSKRLGSTTAGAEEIKNHPWFSGIEWSKVYNHRYQPPLLPVVADGGDSSNFADYSDQLSSYMDVNDQIPGPYFPGF